jgi:hypothetical protein
MPFFIEGLHSRARMFLDVSVEGTIIKKTIIEVFALTSKNAPKEIKESKRRKNERKTSTKDEG